MQRSAHLVDFAGRRGRVDVVLAVDALHDVNAALIREPALGDHLVDEGGVVGHAVRPPPDVPPGVLALGGRRAGSVLAVRAGDDVGEL